MSKKKTGRGRPKTTTAMRTRSLRLPDQAWEDLKAVSRERNAKADPLVSVTVNPTVIISTLVRDFLVANGKTGGFPARPEPAE